MVRTLARSQQERGSAVTILAVVEGGETHPFVTAALRDGLDCRPLASAGRAYWREVTGLVGLFRSLGPGATVHSHGYRADVLAGLAAGRSGLRRVSTVHGFTGGDLKNRFYEWVQVRALSRFDRVVAVSRSVAVRLGGAGVPASRIVLVPNAHAPGAAPVSRVAARQALGIPADGMAIGWVGRLGPEKDPETMVRALAQLGGHSIAVVIGSGPEGGRVMGLARTLGVSDRIRWCGSIPEAGRLFAAFDCYALTSVTEGTPMVLLEAAAAGVPIVATAVGGVPDLVGETEGWLVPPGSPEPFAAALAEALDSSGEGRRRAAKARARIKDEFNADRWVERYATVYNEVTR